jgi:ATP-dependent RNA helicase DeaD
VQAAGTGKRGADRDLLVSAQTGSGKTVAYGLALASTLLGDAERLERAAEPLALVVAPTRELALQVQRELSWLYQHAGARVTSSVGGMDPRREQRQLAEGAHIVVGTPGRLRDHLERGRLDLSQLRAVVLDEADEMLDLGFREDLEFILEAMPVERRTLLFSATLPKPIVALARSFQRNPVRVEVARTEGGHADIEYRAMRVLPREITHGVVNTLRLIEAPGALVFCNTREAVRHLHALLLERGFSAVALSGELSQSERNQALQALRDGRARVCVATDVAARGIDLPGLGLVIHADLPHDAEALQHRSGRTGRAGRKGVSVLLVPPSRRRRAEQMMAAAGLSPIWSGPPSADEIRALDQQRLLGNALFEEEPAEEDSAMAQALLAQHSPDAIATAFAKLYRQRLPAPEDVSDPGFATGRRDAGPGGPPRERERRPSPSDPTGARGSG